MGKLSKDDIQSIDAYLENSDIVFADIRMEMVDHVASAIEEKINNGDKREFYYIFKDYMVENKAALLSDNKKFIKLADKKIVRLLVKSLLSIQSLLIFVCIFCFTFLAFRYFGFNIIRDWIIFIPIFPVFTIALVYWISVNSFNLNRFSAVERLALFYFFFMQLFNMIFTFLIKLEDKESNYAILLISLSLSLTILAILYQTSIKIVKKYSKRFKRIS